MPLGRGRPQAEEQARPPAGRGRPTGGADGLLGDAGGVTLGVARPLLSAPCVRATDAGKAPPRASAAVPGVAGQTRRSP
jgi:hypothetical protein